MKNYQTVQQQLNEAAREAQKNGEGELYKKIILRRLRLFVVEMKERAQ